MRLQDKVCIITEAGSGMGRVAARMFCEQGGQVVAAGACRLRATIPQTMSRRRNHAGTRG
jgi:NAD(P)-dependent dehydrogenase (short-subunit alcohol dehydrogenase family)